MYDLVLKGGRVVDGSGGAAQEADVAFSGDRVAAVGTGLAGREEVDVSGHVVAPGFIDTHSHSDVKILADPTLPMKMRQGITLEVFGQDGISVAPVQPGERAIWKQKLSGLLGDFGVQWDWSSTREYLARVQAARPAVDVAYLAPHGALRQYVMGGDARKPAAHEMDAMRAELKRALDEGACGLSTGLIYPPCCYAETHELVALGEVLAEAGRALVVHMRSESDRILEALAEMIRVGEASGCAIHISHIKIAGRDNWNKLMPMLAMIDEAQASGVTVTADQYPYIAGSTLLGAILPPWAHDGGTEATLARLAQPEQRARFRAEMSETAPQDWDNFWKWSGPEGILVADIPSGRHPEWLGKNLAEVASLQGKDAFETAFDLLLEERMGVAMVSFSQDNALVEVLLVQPWVNTCTDGLLGGRPHPRAYGSYPRILGGYVREGRLLALEQAVRKMTSQAARAMGFEDVGLLQPGQRGNAVVFDPLTVVDKATFSEPVRFPVGIRDVVVGGRFVLRAGEVTAERPGQVRA